MTIQEQVMPPKAMGYRMPLWCACIALVMMAVSVSLTQLFMFLTLTSFALEWLYRRVKARSGDGAPAPTRERPAGAARIIPLVAGLLFAWLLVSTLVHAVGAKNPGTFLTKALRSELGDVWIFLFGMTVLALARDPGRRDKLMGALFVFALVLVLSGLAAMFSEFRLAKILTGHGFTPSARNRPQHHLALLPGGIRIFQPIGFMNTRLTYAGLLIMVLPFLLGHAIARLITVVHAGRPRRELLFAGGAVLLFCAGLLVLYANRTRSAQLGLLAGAAFASLAYAAWRFARMDPARRRHLLFAGAMLVLLAGSMAWWKADLIRDRIDGFSARQSRFTDAYRPIIWTGTGELIRANPVLGVGPGAFPSATRGWREAYSRRFPMIWYFVRNAPDGHAHNDILHLGAVGGLPAAGLFLLLMFFATREFVNRLARDESESEDQSAGRSRYLLAGLIALFPAGLFQCYFQDDEVVVLFWTLMALALAPGLSEKRDTTSSRSA